MVRVDRFGSFPHNLQRLLRLMAVGSALSLVAVCGCSEPHDDDDSDDSDAPMRFEGEVIYHSTVDGLSSCDAIISLSGTAYTGQCDGCTFAFDIHSAVTLDNSAPHCLLHPQWSWIDGRLPLSALPIQLRLRSGRSGKTRSSSRMGSGEQKL